MLNHSASLAMSTSVLKALPGKLDIKRHSPSIPYLSFLYSKRPKIHTIFSLSECNRVNNSFAHTSKMENCLYPDQQALFSVVNI